MESIYSKVLNVLKDQNPKQLYPREIMDLIPGCNNISAVSSALHGHRKYKHIGNNGSKHPRRGYRWFYIAKREPKLEPNCMNTMANDFYKLTGSVTGTS